MRYKEVGYKKMERRERRENVYKVVICDDDVFLCSEIEKMILKITQEIRIEVEVEVYYSGESLCKGLENGDIYDIIFLDIELVKINGVDVGKYIRDVLKDDKVIIIYISAKKQYALQLFKVQPFDFLIKPLQYQEIRDILRKAIKRIDRGLEYFEYQVGKNLYRIRMNEILYFQSDKRKIKLINIENNCIEFYGNLSSIYNKLPDTFIRVHKSYVVNCDYAKEYTYEYVKMVNDEIISISKAYRSAVRYKLLNQGKEK